MTLTRARQALLSVKLLDEIMEMPEDRISTRGFVNRTIERGRIEFRAVRFRYPQTERFVLDGVSLVIRAGEKVGIVGKIGSGKTTLARLVSGLYYANEGEVLIDGIDIRQYHPYEVRRAVGLVVQEADLFQGSVKENILIGKPDAGDEELIEAAKLAGVDDFVSQHPMGYDMPVGERGSALSGGQRQAIALARVLIDKPTVLMLDEPTSSMDHQSERRFLSQMRDAISPDQTVLVATHRHSLLDLVDRLLVIDQGRIVADGPKANVLKALAASRPAQGQS
jgi:ATP-binding cassette subfamily C protein LapB